jgi:hypothetical protein
MIFLNKYTLLAFAWLSSSSDAAILSKPQAVTARITHEYIEQSADGLEKITRYQEQLVRDTTRVWQQRILPNSKQVGEDTQETAHFHVEEAARLVSKSAQELALIYVDTQKKQQIHVQPREFESVSFDGDWSGAYFLLHSKSLAHLRPLAKPAPAGAAWYVYQTKQQRLTVLWSTVWQLPLSILQENLQGLKKQHSITITPQASLAAAPWQSIQHYRVKDFLDTLD